METRAKLWLAASCLLVVVGALSIRAQSPLVVLVLAAALAVAFRRPTVGLGAVCTLLLLLYPASATGSLYGRDSHGFARIAAAVRDRGVWPVEDVVYTWGYQPTPLGHFQVALSSLVTGLDVYPAVHGELLVTSLLPYVNVVLVLGFVYVLARRYAPEASPAWLLAPVVLWTPLFRFYTAPRRGSFGLMLFAFGLFLLYAVRTDRRFRLPLVAVLVVLPLTHHLAALIFLLVLLGLNASTEYRTIGSPLFALGGVVFVAWHVLFSVNAGGFLGLFLRLFAGALTEESTTNQLDPGLLGQVRYYSEFLFVGVLAGLLTVGLYFRWRRDGVQGFAVAAYAFSVIAGVVTVGTWASGFDLDVSRVQTYFVVAGGWLAFAHVGDVRWRRFAPGRSTRLLLVLVLVASAALTVQPHVVSDREPRYETGQLEQHFDRGTYAVAYHVATYHEPDVLVGDLTVLEVVVPTAGIRGTSDVGTIGRGVAPLGGVVVLSDRNDRLFRGWTGGGSNILGPAPRVARFDARNDKVYANGGDAVYVRS